MPVSALLMNISQPPRHYLDNISRDSSDDGLLVAGDDSDRPPTIFHLNDDDVSDEDCCQSRVPPSTPESDIGADISGLDMSKKKIGFGNLSVTEAVAKTSELTSPAARRRLAARKIEMDMNSKIAKRRLITQKIEMEINAKMADNIISKEGEDGDYVPPKQLLIYLVR